MTPGLFRLFLAFGSTIQSLDIQPEDLETLDMGHSPLLSHVPRRSHDLLSSLAAWMSVTNLETVQSVILSRKPRAPCRVEVDVTMAKQTTV
ncbi:hypothetical protein DFH08DRAFT_973765 [Mycena albidolilacea]|uniref:Uncharacterized protein n=1 Tax=Mycena albidolilacea TaxID=1033008 RepID=A0AAD7ED10_9AGAR|nr:hypothetical protein DFH08DRAFT_973765 [Mycena albidolilacea]